MKRFAAARHELAAVSAAWLCVVWQAAVNELYHQNGQSRPSLLLGTLGWASVVGLRLAVQRHLPTARDQWLARSLVVGSWLVVVAILASAPARHVWHVVAGALLTIVLGWLTIRIPEAMWQRVLLGSTVGAVLFATLPMVVATLWGGRSVFPREGVPQARDPQTVQVFLLLDELNASGAGKITRDLQEAGWKVLSKGIHPVAPNTLQVIPELLTGESFPQAKACGPSAVCSGSRVLDFSASSAARPDIDVVGFYHPYCAIQGLRSCVSVDVRRTLWNKSSGEWGCTFLRARQALNIPAASDCEQRRLDFWADVIEKFQAAILDAPAWRSGGMLFVHIPLPHPPGRTASNSLSQHYSENLGRARQLVNAVAQRALGAGKVLQLVIFSDHPLRQAYWCKNSPEYRGARCGIDPALTDTQVPVVVVGHRIPALDGVDKNSEVFRLMRTW